MSNTPKTDRYELYYIETGNVSKLFNLARELESELAQSKEANAGLMRVCDNLERELNEAKETIEMLETRHGATMLCHQAQMDEVTKQRDELAEALKSLCRAIISEEPHGITGLLKRSEAFLAATKGGSHE
jgi:chromosome segregation ATPase